jgi:hypothetical protein
MNINTQSIFELIGELTWTKAAIGLGIVIVIFVIISKIASFLLWPFVRGAIAGALAILALAYLREQLDLNLSSKLILTIGGIVAVLGVFIRKPKSD